MKIAAASDDGKTITGHVGRCEMFLVFDTDGKAITNVEKRENSFTMHKQADRHQQHGHNHGHNREHNHEHNHGHNQGLGHGGSGRHVGIIEGLKDCGYLFCCSGGPGLIDDLNANGIQTFFTGEMDAEEAVKLFLEGRLQNDPDRQCREHRH
ncbi:MAG: NifB/NifX family molybdenum-iron cluster-binding protein [Ignavibacteria bacterium]|jgi:predicted Fe-Mo cluster-binding NifX family protein|nr:NifB/NifX family molybdenum-iron cluster-binding protein [Ignavibacteria bacterium]